MSRKLSIASILASAFIAISVALVIHQSTAFAGGGAAIQFNYSIGWGNRIVNYNRQTSWSAYSTADRVVNVSANQDGNWITYQTKTLLNNMGTGGIYVGDPNNPDVVEGIQVINPSNNESFLSLGWQPTNCSEGPQVSVSMNDPTTSSWMTSIQVTNTTTQTLTLVMSSGSMATLTPSSSYYLSGYDYPGMDAMGMILVQTAPDTLATHACATIGWNWNAIPNPTTPTPTPVATSTPTTVVVTPVGPLPGLPLVLPVSQGWDNVSLPCYSGCPSWKADDLLGLLAKDGLQPVAAVAWINGGWEVHLYQENDGNNFSLIPGQGYFVRLDASGNWVPPTPTN